MVASDTRQSRESSSFLSKMTFSYLNALISFGYSNQLDFIHYPNIEFDSDANLISRNILDAWNSQLVDTHPSLFNAIKFVFFKPLVYYTLLHFLYTVLRLAGTISFAFFLQSFSDPNLNLYLFASLMIFFYLLTSFVQHTTLFLNMQTGIRMKVGLIGVIYRKILKLKSSNSSSTGQIVFSYNIGESHIKRCTKIGRCRSIFWIFIHHVT